MSRSASTSLFPTPFWLASYPNLSEFPNMNRLGNSLICRLWLRGVLEWLFGLRLASVLYPEVIQHSIEAVAQPQLPSD